MTNLTQRGARANQAARLPALPAPPASVDAETRRWMESVREWLEVRLGSRGDFFERAVTHRELQAALDQVTTIDASGSASTDRQPEVIRLANQLRSLSLQMQSVQNQFLTNSTSSTTAIQNIYNQVRDVAVEDVTVFAHAMRPTVTGGCSAFTTVEFGADEPNFHCLLFDPTTEESADFPAMLPFAWVGKKFRVYVYWGHGSGATAYGVTWEIQANSTGDNQPLVLPFDTGTVVTDTGGTAGNLYIAAVSDPVEVTSNMTGEGDMVNLRIVRKTAHASDTLDVDAALLAVRFTLSDVVFPGVPTNPDFLWNSSDKHADVTLSNANLTCTASAIWRMVRGTVGKSSGKWYFEVTFVSVAVWTTMGIATASVALTDYVGRNTGSYGLGPDHTYDSSGSTSHANSISAGGVGGVAVDLDNGKIWFASNNVWLAGGDPAAGTGARYSGIPAGTYYPAAAPGLQSLTINAVLTYTPPSGFTPWA